MTTTSLQARCCGCCFCCSCSCSCRSVCRQVQYQVRRALVARSGQYFPLSPFPFLALCLFGITLGLSDPVSIASLFGRSPCRSPGCRPDPAPSPGGVHAGTVINPDPPCSTTPPCHVSVRHVIVLIHPISALLCCSLPNAFFLRSSSLFFLAPPLRLNVFLLLFSRLLHSPFFALFSELSLSSQCFEQILKCTQTFSE